MRRDAFLCVRVYVYRRVRCERVNSYNTKRKPRVLRCDIIYYYCACNNIIRFFGSAAKLIVAILYFMYVVIMISSWRRRRTYKQYRVQYTHCTHDIPYVITMCVIILLLLLLYAVYAHIARKTTCLLFFFSTPIVSPTNKFIATIRYIRLYVQKYYDKQRRNGMRRRRRIAGTSLQTILQGKKWKKKKPTRNFPLIVVTDIVMYRFS